jgi:hypothetical protein
VPTGGQLFRFGGFDGGLAGPLDGRGVFLLVCGWLYCSGCPGRGSVGFGFGLSAIADLLESDQPGHNFGSEHQCATTERPL